MVDVGPTTHRPLGKARVGDRVQMLLLSRLDDGSFVDEESEWETPTWMTVGKSDQLPVVHDAVMSMVVGDKKHLVISPDKAYGERDERRTKRIELKNLPVNVAVGDRFSFTQGDHEHSGIIQTMNSTHAILDMNHPLAGRTLTVDLHLIAINR